MKLSSVSPDLCEMIVLKLLSLARLIVSSVSVSVPTWFNLIRIALPAFFVFRQVIFFRSNKQIISNYLNSMSNTVL